MYILGIIIYLLHTTYYVYICKFMHYVNVFEASYIYVYIFAVLSLIQRGRTHDKCTSICKIDADLICTGRFQITKGY